MNHFDAIERQGAQGSRSSIAGSAKSTHFMDLGEIEDRAQLRVLERLAKKKDHESR